MEFHIIQKQNGKYALHIRNTVTGETSEDNGEFKNEQAALDRIAELRSVAADAPVFRHRVDQLQPA
ncbi:MAG: hypothetical protein OXG37_12450 [Actinomycetia bacterium]|nr:hypothetical protein [Actinomycetes bacterium]